MHLFFEEDGAFKAGVILSQAGSAYQVELPTGKRTKVKGGHVLFTFASPAPEAFLALAQEIAQGLDADFLWEALEDAETGFEEAASAYFGESARPEERAGMLLALHAHPVYFHRKGRGVFRRAPAQILEQAKAALKKKAALEAQKKAWVEEIVQKGGMPEPLARNAVALLVSPDKNSIAYKALSEAAATLHKNPLALLMDTGAIPSAYDWHTQSFYARHFPGGTGFPAKTPEPDVSPFEAYPLAGVRAFSIDNLETTEIDDAFSVEETDSAWLVGIHIAAPSLAIARDDAMDAIAQARFSTVYAPGLKVTMLPEAWAEAFSLKEGKATVAVSLYASVDKETFEVTSTRSCIERVFVEKNLRTERIEDKLAPEGLENDALDMAFGHELSVLYRTSRALVRRREEVRGRPEVFNRTEYTISLEGEGPSARVRLSERARGAPVDFIVGELMIFANATWGAYLEEAGYAGIYRTQGKGKVKMTSVPGPHESIGVAQYAWCTSPVRRYVDLVNQRQIVAALTNREAVYRASDADLFSIISNFTLAYAAYAEFQKKMERYWSLRYIEQEGFATVRAVVVGEDLVQLEKMPFLQRIPGLPALSRGQVITLNVVGLDYLDVVLEATLASVLDENASEAILEEDAEDEAAEAEDPNDTQKED